MSISVNHGMTVYSRLGVSWSRGHRYKRDHHGPPRHLSLFDFSSPSAHTYNPMECYLQLSDGVRIKIWAWFMVGMA